MSLSVISKLWGKPTKKCHDLSGETLCEMTQEQKYYQKLTYNGTFERFPPGEE